MKKYFLLLSLLVLVFASCEDVIDVKLNDGDTNLFAVEASITSMDEPSVFLAKAMPVTVDHPLEGISGAVVIISDDAQPANTVMLIEDPDSTGYYIVPENIDYYGKAGNTYKVSIESNGTTLTSTEYLAPVAPVDSIEIKPSLMGDKRFLGIFIYSLETPGPGNYYKWDVYVNDQLVNDAENIVVASDELVDGNYVPGLEVFTDFHDPKKPEERKLKPGDKIYVKQTSISCFSYNFYTQMLSQSMTGFLFSVPPANVKSNYTTSDGKTVLGIFNARDISLSATVTIDEAIESGLSE